MLRPDSFRGPKSFARWMLRDDRMPIQIDTSRACSFRGGVLEVILFRESCWQVGLIAGFPGFAVPQHRHMRVDSVELCLGGGVSANVGSIDLKPFHRGGLAANLVRVPAGVWHGGKAGPNGVIWLSFQHWLDGTPGWVTQDWEEECPA